MKTLVFTIIAVAGSFSISGCASDPAADEAQRQALSRHFVPVQAHQTNDMILTCEDLRANLDDVVSAISALDTQIAYQKQTSNSFSVMSALASISGAYAPNIRSAQLASAEGSIANAGAQIESNQSASTKELRDMYQYRHDTLMQLFYGRNCSGK
jgi:flagellar capping protein FliD